MIYSEQLKQRAWYDKRKKILDRDRHRCISCNSDKKLQVHHIYYINGNLAWQHPDKALITLCNKCHKTWHDNHKIEIREKSWTKNREYLPPKRHGTYIREKIKVAINDLPPDERKKLKKKRIMLEHKSEIINKKLELLATVDLPQEIKDRLFNKMDYAHILKYLKNKELIPIEEIKENI
jgi:hypothetical protein